MDNLHNTWKQGYFVDGHRYDHWTDEAKEKAQKLEEYLVRPYPLGNAICSAASPEEAKWIAQRLNLASTLEQLTYDYATGKIDGDEIVKLVMDNIHG